MKNIKSVLKIPRRHRERILAKDALRHLQENDSEAEDIKAFFKQLKSNVHIKVYDDQIYIHKMEKCIKSYLNERNSNKSYKFCLDCFALVTVCMQENHTYYVLKILICSWCMFRKE